jgi:hypothetical protein
VSGPYVEQTGEVGGAATEKFRTRIAQAVQRGSGNDWLAADYVLDVVRAEVAAAEEEGAAKERERIAAAMEAEIRPLLDLDAHHEGGYNCCGCGTYKDILDHAVRIARASS